MNTSNDLLSQESHFEFGKNWASYAKLITQTEVDSAETELRRLLGGRLDGKRFLDIGCGSGLHSLAAIRLGASEVVAVDIDPDSVETTRQVLALHAADASWRTCELSVFDLDPKRLGEFDIVYSWGVLHHTGDLHRALPLAAGMLRPGGQFAFALYRKTLFCPLWKIEKRWYAHARPRAQAVARRAYLALFRLACLLKMRSYGKYLAEYRTRRGMDLLHDIHDWMGGWPYESIFPREVERVMRTLGLSETRSFVRPWLSVGVFGSGCDEYVYSKCEHHKIDEALGQSGAGMNMSNDLLSQESHFEFGKNWASYAKLITQTEIDSAESELQRLLGGRLDGKRFLDIGCGSGLHSLAAIRLGASEVVAVDIDPNSVETTVRVLSANAAEGMWRAIKLSVFDISPESLGQFDVVYSWGVLHHTGAMYRALELAAKMVRSGGDFAFALYRSTPFCWFWKIEKRRYARASRSAQAAARAIYIALVKLRLLLVLRSYKRHVADYCASRGMDYLHDVHDWMGGWPYESISPGAVEGLMQSMGLKSKRSFLLPRFILGFFGSGCDEYVYSRPEEA